MSRSARRQVTELQHALAQAEQDKLLLDAKLQDVSSFEHRAGPGQPVDRQLASMRGKLLAVANEKIISLERDLLVTHAQHTTPTITAQRTHRTRTNRQRAT